MLGNAISNAVPYRRKWQNESKCKLHIFWRCHLSKSKVNYQILKLQISCNSEFNPDSSQNRTFFAFADYTFQIRRMDLFDSLKYPTFESWVAMNQSFESLWVSHEFHQPKTSEETELILSKQSSVEPKSGLGQGQGKVRTAQGGTGKCLTLGWMGRAAVTVVAEVCLVEHERRSVSIGQGYRVE